MRKSLVVFLFSLLFVFSIAVQAQGGSSFSLSSSDDLGQFLVDSGGNTVYIFTVDSPNASDCSGDCLGAWPPVTVDSADAEIVADGFGGTFGVIEREDTGEFQVTYNRAPLYYFTSDAGPGDTTGQGVGDVWWVARPQVLGLGSSDELGSFLTDPAGNTLYIFTVDEEGVSNCSGDCLGAWPAYTVTSADELFAGFGVVAQADLDVITRADTGELQVTYQGQPLYYFSSDAAAGDTTGQAVGDVWFVENPAVYQTVSMDGMGDVLVGRDGTTLYTFTNDTDGVSVCSGICAVVWPPLLATEADLAAMGDDMMASVSLAEHPDGGMQVVYEGQPLYYFFNDAVPGDTTGEGVGDVWFVATGMAMEMDSGETCSASPNANVNLRTGPSTFYAVAGTFLSTDSANVIGQSLGTDGFVWWQLESSAWVRSDLVTTEGTCGDNIPTVTVAPPPPTAVPVAQPTAAPDQPAQPEQPANPPPPQTTEES